MQTSHFPGVQSSLRALGSLIEHQKLHQIILKEEEQTFVLLVWVLVGFVSRYLFGLES